MGTRQRRNIYQYRQQKSSFSSVTPPTFSLWAAICSPGQEEFNFLKQNKYILMSRALTTQYSVQLFTTNSTYIFSSSEKGKQIN